MTLINSLFFYIGLSAFLITSIGYSQSLPKINYRDYGYTKPIKQSAAIYYSIEGDSIEKVEHVLQKFNAQGNIESYHNQSYLDDSWASAKSTYKKERLHKEVWTHSNAYLNRTYAYSYNAQNQLVRQKIRFKDGVNSALQFKYLNNRLQQIDADIDGVKSVTEKVYSTNGTLYKEIYRQQVPNQAALVTQYFYLDDKEIMSYQTPQNNCYVTVYINNTVQIHFKVVDSSDTHTKLLKGIQRFEKEAPNDNLPFNLKSFTNQTLQAYDKYPSQLIPYHMVMFLHDANNSIIAEAEVAVKTKEIVGIGFFEIQYSDGTTTGTTAFNQKTVAIFKTMLQQTGLH